MDSDGAMEEEVWRLLVAGEEGLADRWSEILASVRGTSGAGGEPALTLGQVERLRASHGQEVARFASLQDEMTRRARRRFPDGWPLFWTSKGLEQATPAAVSTYRAARFAGAATPASLVWDACCGVGSDAVALLRAMRARGARVPLLATDWDVGSARCAAANLGASAEALGPTGEAAKTEHLAAQCDLRQPPMSQATLAEALVLLDPDRRPDGEHREPRPDRWAPPLPETLTLALGAQGACVKLPPSLDASAEGLDRITRTAWQLEWISLDGEMKELALWTGALATAREGLGDGRLATALASHPGAVPAHYSSDAEPCSLPGARPTAEVGPGDWLVELDPTLWQSDLAGAFCLDHGLQPIETEIRGMFLVSADRPESPLARCWPILDRVSADRKRVRKLLRQRGIGPITVKKRNHPKSSIELEADFRGSGDLEGLLAVFRVPGSSVALLLGR